MKRRFVSLAAAAVILCTGCGTHLSQDNSNHNYDNRMDSFTQSSSTQTVSDSESFDAVEEFLEKANEIAANAVSVTYDQLARSVDGNFGEWVYFTGEIVQVIEYDENYQGLIAITLKDAGLFTYYDDPVYYRLPKLITDVRPLEGDIVTFYGTTGGLYTYTGTDFTKVTVPQIYVAKMTLN